MAINTVVLMGRLTYPPELKSTATGKSVTRFQLAVDRTYQPKGQEKQADFIDCVAFDKTAEFVHNYFSKGSMLALTGSIQTNTFTDKDGNNRKSIEVVANNVSFCEKKEAKPTEKPNLSVPVEESKYEEVGNDDDFPF